jgi:chemotaxis protein CheX
MKVEFINPFVSSVCDVLEKETKARILQRGELHLVESSRTSKDVTILISITGSIEGFVLYGMSEEVALKIASVMIGEEVSKFDEMSQSAIAELGNIITGNASIGLEKAGYPCKVSPPSLVIGKDTVISTVNIKRLSFTIITDIGKIEVDVALKEKNR